MAGFEDLIRGALRKQGDSTPQQREAIYRSSREALERMLAKNDTLGAQAMELQRTRLKKAIIAIEASYEQPIVPTPTPTIGSQSDIRHPEPVSVEPPTRAGQPAEPSPDLKTPNVPRPPDPDDTVPLVPPPATGLSSEFDDEPDDSLDSAVGSDFAASRPDDFQSVSYDPALLRERRPYAKILLWTIIIVGAGVVTWWAINFGPALLREQLDGSVPNPAATIETGGFVPEGSKGWVTVFAPDANPENMEFADQGEAELIRANGRMFARLRSNPGSSANRVRIKVPPGVMESLRGEAATFEVMLRVSEDQEHQFALFCEFAEMGECSRKRFTATQRLQPFIFDVLINDAQLSPGTDAYLAINTDVNLGGKPLDLFSIKVRTGS